MVLFMTAARSSGRLFAMTCHFGIRSKRRTAGKRKTAVAEEHFRHTGTERWVPASTPALAVRALVRYRCLGGRGEKDPGSPCDHNSTSRSSIPH